VDVPQVPHYTYDHLKRKSDAFLGEFNPSRDIPVPIEEIVDIHFNVDIVPMPGLQSTYDTVGFTTADLTAIYIDEFVYTNRPARYRFTLAHEIGHAVLHADFYRSRSWKNIKEWKRGILAIPDDQYRFLEWHANAFAGLVLVPESQLDREISRCEATIRKHAPKVVKEPEAYREFLEICLAKRFDVSTGVISRRLNKRADD
jgi:Zn-dependent peptidase ImmA (M78 family)